MQQDCQVSVVIPLYNEQDSLEQLTQELTSVLQEAHMTFEIIFVDDGSTDQSWEVIQNLNQQDSRVKAIKFNRNYGKSAGLSTGFSASRGNVVVTMDADLQDNPEEIPELYRMIMEDGYDLVSGWKKKRYDPITKTLPTKIYNACTRWMSGIKLHDFNCGLKAFHYRVVKTIEVYGEMHRYIPLIAKWHGFYNIGEKVVKHRSRRFGKSKFGNERFIRGFLDLLSISFVSKFSKRPMHFFGMLGIVSFLLGFLFTVHMIWDKLSKIYIYDVPVEREIVDRPLFFLSLVALIVGVQLFLTGFIAEMVSRNSPDRNAYIIETQLGFGDEQ